jgi:DNA mismatch endonuclease, patch repair protein
MMSRERRSALMSRIRSRNTEPELIVRRLLHALGYRYVLHDGRLPGSPDLAFPSRRKAIFVHGCFWHGHSCGRGFRPKTNSAFWASKIDLNTVRDRRQVRALTSLGWRSLTVWECAARPARLAALKRRLVAFLES